MVVTSNVMKWVDIFYRYIKKVAIAYKQFLLPCGLLLVFNLGIDASLNDPEKQLILWNQYSTLPKDDANAKFPIKSK